MQEDSFLSQVLLLVFMPSSSSTKLISDDAFTVVKMDDLVLGVDQKFIVLGD